MSSALARARSSCDSASPVDIVRRNHLVVRGSSLGNDAGKMGKTRDIDLSYSYARQTRGDADRRAMARKNAGGAQWVEDPTALGSALRRAACQPARRAYEVTR